MVAEATALYRACLRSIRRMPSAEHRVTWLHYVRLKFDAAQGINFRDKDKARRALQDGWEEVRQMNYYSDMRQTADERMRTDQGSSNSVKLSLSRPVDGTTLSEEREPQGGTQHSRESFVHSWLLKILPNISDEDRKAYCRLLLDMGFESEDMLLHLTKEDLSSFRVAHRKALLRAVDHLQRPSDKNSVR